MSTEFTDNLRRLNPWWQGRPAPPVPVFRRWPYERLLRLLRGPSLAPATVLSGPRRVGKTVLVQQVMRGLLAEGVEPKRVLYVPFDELPLTPGVRAPVLAVAQWFEDYILESTFNTEGRAGKPPFILFDEIQNLEAWAPQLKNLVDNHAVRVLLTGSSSLQIEAGRDSLAGRITTIALGPLLLREIAALRWGQSPAPFWTNGDGAALGTIDFWRGAVAHAKKEADLRRRAFETFCERGAYPLAHERSEVPWPELADYLNETVIKRAIQHDLRTGPRGQRRDEALLERVFWLSCRYAGQPAGPSIFVPEVRQSVDPDIGWNKVLSYLKFLDGSLLLRLIPPLEMRLLREHSPSKIVLSDHTLRASWTHEIVPLSPAGLAADPDMLPIAGHVAESVLGYFLASIPNLDVAYYLARGLDSEVDFVITSGTRRIPIEMKYSRKVDPHDSTRGIRGFLEKTVYNAPLGLLVTLDDDVTVYDPRVIPISLSSLLWLR